MPDELGIIDSLIIAGLVDRSLRAGSPDELEPLFRWMWASRIGREFHGRVESRLETRFLKRHALVVELIRRLTDASCQDPVSTLCEIGSGSGVVLDYLARNLPRLDSLIGIDLNPMQSESNGRRFTDPRMLFRAADAADWIPEHGGRNWLYFTNDGVLEYFTAAKLHNMLTTIARLFSPATFVIVEPLAQDHDLDLTPHSLLYGHELTFSHNYPFQFRASGYEVVHQSEQTFEGQRWIELVAHAGPRLAVAG